MRWTEPASRLFASTVVVAVLSAGFVALRFVSRGRLLRVLGPTDWFMVVALLFAIASTVSVGVHISYGLGRPFIELGGEQEKRDFFKVQYFANVVNNISLVLTKVSVLLLFLDVFVITWIRKATYVVLGATVFYGTWVAMTSIFACIPIYSYWELTPDKTCLLSSVKYFTDAGISLTLDFVMLFLPVPIIWPMTLRKTQKAWLYFLFALGVCVCVVSVLRVYLLSVARTNIANASAELDVIYWCMLEINLPIMIACIPTLKPLAAKLYPRLLSMPEGGDETSRHPPTIASAPRRLHSFDGIEPL